MIKIIFSLIVLFFGLSSHAGNLELKAFESDGCTMGPDGTISHPKLWQHCCYEHDLRYWFGGSSDDMDFTDLELKACVKNVAGEVWSKIIYQGVRAGHGSPIKSKYAWSWGWTTERNEGPLMADEVKYVKCSLDQLPLDPGFRQGFIEKYLP